MIESGDQNQEKGGISREAAARPHGGPVRRFLFPTNLADKDAQPLLGKLCAILLIGTLILGTVGAVFFLALDGRAVLAELRTKVAARNLLKQEQAGEVEQAFLLASKRHQADPSNPHWVRIMAQIATRQSSGPISPFWDKLAELEPLQADDWDAWMTGLRDRSEHQEAHTQCLQFRQAFPEDVRAHRQLAAIARALGRPEEEQAALAEASRLAPDDPDLLLSSRGATLRHPESSLQDRLVAAEALWKLADENGSASKRALEELWRSPLPLPGDGLRLCAAIEAHPETPYPRVLASRSRRIGFAPQQRAVIVAETAQLHADRRGHQLASLGHWLNEHGGVEETWRLGTEQRLRGNAHFWEPYLEAGLALGFTAEVTAAVEREDCPLSGAHLDLVRAHAAALGGEERKVVETFLEAARREAQDLGRHRLLVEVGRFADAQQMDEIAEESLETASLHQESSAGAFRALLQHGLRRGDLNRLVRWSGQAVENETLREEFLPIALYYHFLAGHRVEYWWPVVRDQLAADPESPTFRYLAALAAHRLGHWDEARRLLRNLPLNSVPNGQRSFLVLVLTEEGRRVEANYVRQQMDSEVLPAEAHLLTRARLIGTIDLEGVPPESFSAP